MSLLRDKIAEKTLDYIVGGVSWIFVSLMPIQLSNGLLNDPFYHAGWFEENKAWILLFGALWLISLCSIFRVWGLVLITLIAMSSSLFFAFYYRESVFMDESWQLLVWIVHGVSFSTLPGMIAGWLILALKLMRSN